MESGGQERSRSLDAGECLAGSAVGEPDARERQLAHEREGGPHVFADRERLLEFPFRRDEVTALERDSPAGAYGVHHRGVSCESDGFGICERSLREVLGLGQ